VTHSSSTKHEEAKSNEKVEAKTETKTEKSGTAESTSSHGGDKA